MSVLSPRAARDPSECVGLGAGAVFDLTDRYRYLLWRTWDTSRGTIAFVMLNPNAADAVTEDPSIRRCVGFARSWGYGRLMVANLFAFRSPDPKAIAFTEDPVGPLNEAYLSLVTGTAETVVAAWGNGGRLCSASKAFRERFGRDALMRCLGLTGQGEPKHPLYLPATTRLVLYAPPE